MFRPLAIAFVAAAVVSFGSMAAARAQGTVRIEPRPFYGAVVTLEEGVRVIRPLPPERYVIINPDNKTPLSISINDSHVSERRVIENKVSGDSNGAPVVYGRGGAAWGIGGGLHHGRHFGHGRMQGGH